MFWKEKSQVWSGSSIHSSASWKSCWARESRAPACLRYTSTASSRTAIMRRRSPSCSLRRRTRSKNCDGSKVSGWKSPASRSSAAYSRSFICAYPTSSIVPSGTQNSGLFLQLCLRRPRCRRIQPGHHAGRYPRSPHVGDRGLLEQFHDTALPLAPYPLHAAGAKQRAVRMLARAHVERDGALHRLDHVAEGHLLGRTAEDVPAVRPAAGAHQPLVDQLLDDLLEELPGHALALRDLADRAGARAGLLVRQVDHRAERVVDLPAHLHDRHGASLKTPSRPPTPSGCVRACPRWTPSGRPRNRGVQSPTGASP